MTLEEAIKVLRQHNVKGASVLRITRGQALEKDLLSQVLDSCEQLISQKAEYKRLLKAAVEDIRYCMRSYDPCEVCALLEENGECAAADDDDCNEKYKWRYEAEVLTLIGKDIDVPASADDTNVGHKSGGWISCKDRMPEFNEPVLFIFNTESGFKAVMYGWHETIKGLGSGWHQAGVGGARADEEVTHWMPLPEPPKDGEQDD